SSLGSRTGNLHDTYLHVSVLKVENRTCAGNAGRGIQRLGFDDENSADGVLRLDKRAVDDLAASDRQASTCLIVKLVRADELSSFAKLFDPAHVAFDHQRPECGVRRTFVDIGAACNQHECRHQLSSRFNALTSGKSGACGLCAATIQSAAAPAVEFTTVAGNMRARSDGRKAAAFAVSAVVAGSLRKFNAPRPAITSSFGRCETAATTSIVSWIDRLSTFAVVRKHTARTPAGPTSMARFSASVSIAPNAGPMAVAPETCPLAGLPVRKRMTPRPRFTM